MSAPKPTRALRDRIKSELPKDTFDAAPWRLAWFLPLTAIIAGCWLWLANYTVTWYQGALIALLIGHLYGSLGFLSHEVSHGAMGIKGRWKDFFAGIGFAPFLVTPQFWHEWHNVVHHGNTNMGDADPDSFGNAHRYERNPGQKKLLKLAPGSGTWYSYLFLFYSFTLHSQAVLWLQTKHRKAFAGLNRRRAIVGMLTLLAGWIVLAIWLGPQGTLYGIVLPHFIGNFVIQSYILTNHFLRPQDPHNNPIDNSMSVRTHALLDRLHFRFSHHVEHHMFPKMPMHKAPRLRAWFEKNLPERYVCPSHAKALLYLYQTPKVYLDAHTLVDVNAPTQSVDLHALNRKLNPQYQPMPRPIRHSQENVSLVT